MLLTPVVAVLAVAAIMTVSSNGIRSHAKAASRPVAAWSTAQPRSAPITSSVVSTQVTTPPTRPDRVSSVSVPSSSTTPAATPAPTATAAPVAHTATTASTTTTTTTTVNECSIALAYLATHAKPGFAHYCLPGSSINVGVPGTSFRCPYGGPEILVADPACAISYENEASNSYWDFSSGAIISPGSVQDGRTWDPYGECP